jgi:alpha-1,6-mannosyltransferase
MTGLALLIVVVASPTVWPWYYLWGLSLLAATSAQRSLFMAWVAGLAMLLVGPGGTPMIGGNGFYASGPLVLAGLIWFWSRDHWRTIFDGVDRVE